MDRSKLIDTHVVGADLPTYPIESLAAGTEGAVDLRLSLRGDDVIDVDVVGPNPKLNQAAAANVRTWRLRNTEAPVLMVKFHYRLLPGDCQQAPVSQVTMAFPYEVVVESRKKCVAADGGR